MSSPTDAGPGYGYGYPGPAAAYGPPSPPHFPPSAAALPAPVGRSSRRGLWWGVAGALAASAVWAAAVITVPTLVTIGGPLSPGGYRVVNDLCGAARLSRFTQLYPAQSGVPYHYSTRHSTLDDMYCSQYRKRADGDSEYSSLYLEAQLHKAVDPRPEFAAQRASLRQRRYRITPVHGLGQEAYVGYLDDPSSADHSWHYLTQVLYVRDGALTYYLSWSGSYQVGKSSPPDPETLRQALVMDSRDVLTAIGGAFGV